LARARAREGRPAGPNQPAARRALREEDEAGKCARGTMQERGTFGWRGATGGSFVYCGAEAAQQQMDGGGNEHTKNNDENERVMGF